MFAWAYPIPYASLIVAKFEASWVSLCEHQVCDQWASILYKNLIYFSFWIGHQQALSANSYGSLFEWRSRSKQNSSILNTKLFTEPFFITFSCSNSYRSGLLPLLLVVLKFMNPKRQSSWSFVPPEDAKMLKFCQQQMLRLYLFAVLSDEQAHKTLDFYLWSIWDGYCVLEGWNVE